MFNFQTQPLTPITSTFSTYVSRNMAQPAQYPNAMPIAPLGAEGVRHRVSKARVAKVVSDVHVSESLLA